MTAYDLHVQVNAIKTLVQHELSGHITIQVSPENNMVVFSWSPMASLDTFHIPFHKDDLMYQDSTTIVQDIAREPRSLQTQKRPTTKTNINDLGLTIKADTSKLKKALDNMATTANRTYNNRQDALRAIDAAETLGLDYTLTKQWTWDIADAKSTTTYRLSIHISPKDKGQP